MTAAEKRIKEYGDYIEENGKKIAELEVLLACLKKAKGKVMDKRTFAEFEEDKGLWKWYRFSCDRNTQGYGAPYRIKTGVVYLYVELESREVAEAIEKIPTMLAKLRKDTNEAIGEMEKIKTVDEDALIADLIAVYEKHGRPSIWGEVLEVYQVKYPKEK